MENNEENITSRLEKQFINRIIRWCVVYAKYMAKLKLPPGNKIVIKSLQMNGREIVFTAPENHSNKSDTVQLLQRGLREGVFTGISLGGDGKLD